MSCQLSQLAVAREARQKGTGFEILDVGFSRNGWPWGLETRKDPNLFRVAVWRRSGPASIFALGGPCCVTEPL